MPKRREVQNVPAVASAGLPSWVQQMRDAAVSAISADDIKAIVAKQVEMAKTGDEKALKFVFDQILGGASFKGATFVQHVYNHDPESPTHALPGSNGKVDAMAARAAAGKPLFDEEDEEPDLD